MKDRKSRGRGFEVVRQEEKAKRLCRSAAFDRVMHLLDVRGQQLLCH